MITVIDADTKPPQKRLYFPTAKDRARGADSNDQSCRDENIFNCNSDSNNVETPIQSSNSNHIAVLSNSTQNVSDVKADIAPLIDGKGRSNFHSRHIDSQPEGSLSEESADEHKNILKERQYFKSPKRVLKSLNLQSSRSISPRNESFKKSPPKSASPSSKSPSANHLSPISKLSQSAVDNRQSLSSSFPVTIVEIEDYAFNISHVEIKENQSILFRLSKEVPLHAEHLLFGESSNRDLKFEAPLLQVILSTN